MVFKRNLGNFYNFNKELSFAYKAARKEVGSAQTAYTNAKQAVSNAKDAGIDGQAFADLQHQMQLAWNGLAAAKEAVYLTVKDGLETSLYDAKAMVSDASRAVKRARDAASVRAAERALTKALKLESKVEYNMLVMELKRVQGELRTALWVRNCSKDAARVAEYEESANLRHYYRQVELAEEALSASKAELRGIIADILDMEG